MEAEYDPNSLVLWKEKQTLITTSSLCLQDVSTKFFQTQKVGFQAGRCIQGRNIQLEDFLMKSVPGLCCFWDSTLGHRISLGTEREPVTVPPVFNTCFVNTTVKISFHKRVLVPYRNIYFHHFFSNQFFSKTCILLHLCHATRRLIFTKSPK